MRSNRQWQTKASNISGRICQLHCEAKQLPSPHACKEFAHSVAIPLMQSDVAATNSLAQAIDRGDRLLVAIDVDTADSELRVLSVAPNQRITQHAAFGLIAPSDARN
ncbi:hypothetical protein ABQE70_17130 [Xanthomonas campestris pv. campestris]|uniref:hypothetical protein n=2 Tax=Xanthomonas campestris TaxID=339 RepID=UPI002367A730|nr:hypothetical protein [Xanthomonas campestris]WDJ86173.1 hypothetical protein JH279_06035 [Xanthomonas campestris pv. incanae]WDK24731.1 hypothetical protein JH274_15650 [Xanthomonas campestris pv. incanae]